MNPGTEELVKKVQSVTNIFNSEGDLVKPAVRFLTMPERVDRENELATIDEFLNQPPAIMRTLHPTPERLTNLRQRRKRIKNELEKSSPPTNLSGEEKDALYKLEKELKAEIRDGMLPWEDMIRNPVGAVDHNVKWQRAKKSAILAFKNVRRALNPDSEDKDLANVEMLRPRRYVAGGDSIPMLDSEAPGHFSYSQIPDEKWEASGLPLVNPNSPLAQMEKRDKTQREMELEKENAELRAALKTKPVSTVKTKSRKPWSEKSKQAARDRYAAQHPPQP